MALLDRLPPATTIPDPGAGDDRPWRARTAPLRRQSVDRRARRSRDRPPDIKELADGAEADGLERVRGRVMGSTGPFAATGSRPDGATTSRRTTSPCRRRSPTATTRARRQTVNDPERRAAAAAHEAASRTWHQGARQAGHGHRRPGTSAGLATIESDPFVSIMRRMNVVSSNFRAEVFGKFLGARVRAVPARSRRARSRSRRSSEPTASASRRTTARACPTRTASAPTRSCERCGSPRPHRGARPCAARSRTAVRAPWRIACADVRRSAPRPARSSTSRRSRAGSGSNARTRGREFSILSQAMSKTQSIQIENAIVRVVSANAGPR